MKQVFNYWDNLHKKDHLEEFNNNIYGILCLKLKSITRIGLINRFIDYAGFKIKAKRQGDQFKELYSFMSEDIYKHSSILDDFIIIVNKEQINSTNIEQLVSELYKLRYFDWGGDYQNSLDKYLISRYIKVNNPSYEYLLSKLETEISKAVQGYVLNSWYNYWTSVLIENIFKSHIGILPTVGKIKNVDFFINNIPFDLKVTYLPAEYIKLKRKEKGLPVEFTFLKQKAKEVNISYDAKASQNDIHHEIIEKLKDKNDELCNDILYRLKKEKVEILEDAQKNPLSLAKWLYEHQGEMRFGSENRLYLILIDTDDFDNSWKLKRNIELLKPTINMYLDNFKNKKIEELKVTFNFKGKADSFSALTDIIFIVK